MYEAIVKAIILSSNQCLPQSKFNRHAKPYWTPEVKKSYSLQREARRVCVLKGQPRGWHNESYAKYKRCKQNFVTTQKIAIENVEKYFNSQLIEAAECDSRLFWSLIKSRKNKRPSACTHLFYKNTSVREPGDILKVFTNYFRDVYSPLQCEHFDNDFKKLVEEKVKQLKIKNNSLERSGQGLNVINVITSNTTLADDIALAAISPNGPNKIERTDKIRHVGIQLNDKMTDNDKISVACKKAESSFYSLLSINIGTFHINPLTSASLVSKICIPKLLFGAELWNNLTKSNCMQLERFIRMAAKTIQRFPIRTRTDICLAMLGWKRIESEINLKKLMFLERLCNMPTSVLTKQIFNKRLALFSCRTDKCIQKGFIPDIIRIFSKYNLCNKK
ncbi:hypothetical protein MAR_034550 [Mya arenaria]|uniref:Reverse transcriptase domain-containing protein n=1 Tax=Mya arenaria TaxID=6604 RepID=A0ABY7GC58_MYAAR|nr:hypothetical protein MAR_034550 [Mya arenaria]